MNYSPERQPAECLARQLLRRRGSTSAASELQRFAAKIDERVSLPFVN